MSTIGPTGIGEAPLVADGIVEGGEVWVPTVGLGRVVALSTDLAVVDVPRLTRVVDVMRRVLIPPAVIAAIPAAHLSNEWGAA